MSKQAQDEKPKKDLSDAIFAMLDAVDVLIDAGENEYARQLKDAAGVMQAKQRQRLADEEKRKFVDAVFNILRSNGFAPQPEDADCFYALYDASCRFTENKAASVTRFEYNRERPDEQHVARFTLMPDQYAELIIKNKAASQRLFVMAMEALLV